MSPGNRREPIDIGVSRPGRVYPFPRRINRLEVEVRGGRELMNLGPLAVKVGT